MDAQHDHAIVGEQVLLDRLFERQHFQKGAVDVLVVHVDRLDAARRQRPFGTERVGARRSGHVEPLDCPQTVVVVDHLKAAVASLPRCVADGAGSAMGFVAEHQIESSGTVVLLCFADAMKRLVGAENHSSRFSATVGVEQVAQTPRRCRHWALQLRNPHSGGALGATTGGLVGADDDALKSTRGVQQPLPACLSDQSDARRHESYAPSVWHHPFGDSQRRESLAGAAGHHHPAPVVM